MRHTYNSLNNQLYQLNIFYSRLLHKNYSMKMFGKLLVYTILFVVFSACSDTTVIQEKQKKEVIEIVKQAEEQREIVSVQEFNEYSPFFSTVGESAIEWKTVVQENDTEKMFVFNASTVFAVNDEIIKSKIVDDEVIINHGIHTGMTRSVFESYFSDLVSNNTPSEDHPIIRLTPEEVYFSCCSEETQYWQFRFMDSILYEVVYFQYTD
jgi:hypothetical protein